MSSSYSNVRLKDGGSSIDDRFEKLACGEGVAFASCAVSTVDV
jgi:hypothetical protein